MNKVIAKYGVFDIVNIFIMLFLLAITLYPLVYVLSVSLSSAHFVKANMIYLLPRGINLSAYKEVFESKMIWVSYKNTIVYTVLGTFIQTSLTTMLAFGMSRKNLIFRKQITVFILFTMFFGGGLIPDFLLIKSLGLYNTIWAILIPGAISTYNMIIIRTFMQGLPEEIFESVRIDGGNDLQIFVRIVLPLSTAVIMTISLFYAVGHWNAYFSAMIYFKDRVKMPLQVILMEMISNSNMMEFTTYIEEDYEPPTSDMLIMASIIVSLIPMLAVYPFVQKYFVKGVMIGSLKG